MRTAPTFETLLISTRGALGFLTLNRPDKLNAISPRMLHELIEAAHWFDQATGISVVLVSGAGRAFCAGFDLNFFASGETLRHEDADLGRRMADRLAGMHALTIAAIQGRCVGGGVVMAVACDLRMAADDAIFSIPEIDMGIPLGWGGIARLVREIGPAMTRELVLDCREFGAAEARALRLVNRCVPASALAEAAQAWASQLAGKAPYLLRTSKQQINAAVQHLLSTSDAQGDADLMLAALTDPDCLTMARNYLAVRRKR